MKKKTIIKIISSLVVFVFIVSIFQFSSHAQATTDSSSIWSNPNQNGDNPYKFKVSDVVNSSLLTSVVGCTGVVNKVSTWMMKFVQSPAQQAKQTAEKVKRIRAQIQAQCATIKSVSEAAGDSIPTIGGISKSIDTSLEKVSVPTLGEKIKACLTKIDSTNDEQLAEQIKQSELQQEQNFKTQCFDGIAITLAKNQLTAMTRSAVNWVNTGYGGNPFFVQSMTNLTNNLERNVLETGEDILLSKSFGSPYAYNFATSTVNSYRSGRGIGSSSSNFLSSLQSDLGAFINDPKSYFNDTRSPLQRAQDVNNAFSNDFSTGGWDGWLALTQREKNNPLGFTMQASDYLARTQAEQINNTKDELLQNGGFLSQKTCTMYQIFDSSGVAKTDDVPYSELAASTPDRMGKLPDVQQTNSEPYIDPNLGEMPGGDTKTILRRNVYRSSKTNSGFDVCVDWKTITPGSIIKDKTTNYLNSPERQLELAKTINDSLNALFSVLISKLEGGGLSGLSENVASTANWIDSTNDLSSIDGTSPYDNNGAYDGFNLTRDLGNTYIHETPILLGTWNATACPPEPADQSNCNVATNTNSAYPLRADPSNKIIKLYPSTAPEVYQVANGGKIELKNKSQDNNKLYGDVVNPTNGYYEVTTSGKAKLLNEGYNGWVKGDRAFWDGSTWQNWKCQPNKTGDCTSQLNPIKKRGVIQIQNDYIVAAKEILGVLPNVMTKLGELDYCLPGPNPSYKTNSTDAQSAYQDWVGSMYVGPKDADRTGWRIDGEGTRTYNSLANTYTDNPSMWSIIKKSISTLTYFNGYHYKPDKSQSDDISNKKDFMNYVQDYVANKMFQDFYSVFDTAMNNLYFKNMTSKYIEKEDQPINYEKDLNPSYMPMAESGLDLTKNITYYNDDITKVSQDYTDAITQAKVNIAKLDPIKAEVSQIIQAAQARRDANLLKQINKINQTAIDSCKATQTDCDNNTENVKQCLVEYNTCIENAAAKGGILSAAQYKTKYAECLKEEDIKVFDIDQITKNSSSESDRCFDGIDNDLNGLIDSKDPACASVRGGSTNTTGDLCPNITGSQTTIPADYILNNSNQCVKGICVLGQPVTGQDVLGGSVDYGPCNGRTTQYSCQANYYTHGSLTNVCDWGTTETVTPYTPPTTSMWGCSLDTSYTHTYISAASQNKSCFIRQQSECTTNDYVDSDQVAHRCAWSAAAIN